MFARSVGRTGDGRRLYGGLALAICLLFGLALLINTQLEGEASWFWYATLLHRGVRLYADLHLPLQPLFVLETNVWMQLVGGKALAMAGLSLLHVVVLSVGFLLVLRSSDWANWQKAIVSAGCFVIFLQAPAYRFDDYHVIAQICMVYSLWLLLRLEQITEVRRQIAAAMGLGVLSGLALTTRLNDGAALLVAVGLIALVLATRRKLLVLGVHLVTAALTLRGVVLLTGDSFRDYVSNSMLHAAASKGGTGSFLRDPFLLFVNAVKVQRIGGKRVLLFLFAVTLAGVVLDRVWRMRTGRIVLVQVMLSAVVFAVCPHGSRQELLLGLLIFTASIALIQLGYLAAPVVAARGLAKSVGWTKQWRGREMLLFLPLAEMASASASTAGQPRQGFFAATALCLLLVPLVWPMAVVAGWVRASFTTLMVLLGVSGITSKVLSPYAWQNYVMSRMFTNRVWYRDPADGPLYVERDLLALSESICNDMKQGGGDRELLSLPYSYPNYFCGVPPWHGYVQTYFDTSTRATINHLMGELETAPPRFLVYQRQMEILRGQEWLYNHNQPLAQRDLDAMILRKLATGQWTLLEKRDYLVGDGWFVIQTRP